MALFAQLTANGLIAGSIYALVAAGFSLIYRTNKFIHFAHGISVAAGGYLLYSFFNLAGIPFFISVIAAICSSGFFGYGVYRLVYLPLQKRKASNVILLMASLAILILFQSIIQIVYGAKINVIRQGGAEGLAVLGAMITPLQLGIIFLSFVLFIGLYLFLNKTRIGLDMKAVADDRKLALITGINERRVSGSAFIIGSILAGVAGVLIGLEQNLSPTMGTSLVIKGFIGAVIGGIVNVPASILGAYILGFAENYGIWFFPSSYKDAIAFIILFGFLLLKPNGLFGKDRRVR